MEITRRYQSTDTMLHNFYIGMSAVAILRGGLGGPWPPRFFAWPPVWPPPFFSLIYRSSSFDIGPEITMQDGIYVGPPYFFLGPAVAPQFFNSRIATGWVNFDHSFVVTTTVTCCLRAPPTGDYFVCMWALRSPRGRDERTVIFCDTDPVLNF